MDPDATLTEIRSLIAQWQAAGSRNDGPDPWTEADADRLAELVADLDRRITRDGFLPTAWAAPRPSRFHIPPRQFG